ncbi:C4-dicarboxylate ABC transporter substrate-binding protein [Rubrobacter taiwanensis]|uniref:C4-dicarboxylate ABC transporter substrate-binding protein n=1 Tax=Rubrobacter taiwanensis TaxID=185139 RepID=A0A4R1BRC4_9ACTN|nr:C4-dicarboxylate ABC transporter substrate-binding protein [Rubrobacter taiwanensis]
MALRVQGVIVVVRGRLLLVVCFSTVALLLTACGLATGGGADDQVTLRLGHQWPGVNEAGEGDFRAVLAQRFADRVNERTDGQVTIEVYPGNSLIEDPTQQYEAIRRGAQDMSVFPLDYASGDVPEFSITLMPAMVRSHAQARNWQDAEIGQRIEEITQENGVKILTWVWNAGAIGCKREEPVVSPDDVRPGMVTRAAGPRVEQMLERVGFGLSSMPSSEIYSAMQTGVLDCAITSTSSFSSYRLYEQVGSYTSPTGGYTFWFMFEPLIIGMDQFEQLTPEQQQIFEEVGAELQEFAYTASEDDDLRVEKEFEEAGVNVVQMDEESFGQWQEESRPVWESFAEEVEGGRELIDLASQVSAQ